MKPAAYILLILSWPCTLVHRAWNRHPVDIKQWFVYRPDVKQDLQWYICDTGNMLAVVFALLGALLYLLSFKRKSVSIPVLLAALVLIQLLDLYSYWFYFKQNELILYFQGCILLISILIILIIKPLRR